MHPGNCHGDYKLLYLRLHSELDLYPIDMAGMKHGHATKLPDLNSPVANNFHHVDYVSIQKYSFNVSCIKHIVCNLESKTFITDHSSVI